MGHYIEMLKKSINRVEADFEFSSLIDHNGAKGTFREKIVENLLRPFLPRCYGLSGGQAFDDQGTLSNQLDIVIYDALFSYIAPYMKDFIYFPCESIYGNIEVKSILNKKSFVEAVNNIRSLKLLHRKEIKSYYVNPMKELIIKNVNWDIKAVNEYLGVVFVYDSVKSSTILKYIKEIVDKGKTKKNDLPNIIVLFKDKKIITRFHRAEDGMVHIHPLGQFDGYLVEECGNNVLAEFMMLLLISLRSIEFKALDLENISKETHKEIFEKKDKAIEHILIR